MPKRTHDIIVTSSDWTVPTGDGVHRRTLVKGAAWTVPVVAMAVATPAAAASKTPTLAFTQPSYTGTACSTITGVQVARTIDGAAPDPGKTISVTLADGYTFAGGGTSFSGTTDNGGLVSLPAINVPANGGNSGFGAASDRLSSSTPVTATVVAGKAFQVASGAGYVVNASRVPDGSTPLAYNAYLTSNGEVWIDGAKRSGTHVVSKAVGVGDEGQTAVSWVDEDGKAFQVASGAGYVVNASGVPDGSTPIVYNAYLTSNGEVWINGAKRSDTHTVAAAAGTGDRGTTAVSWVDGPSCR